MLYGVQCISLCPNGGSDPGGRCTPAYLHFVLNGYTRLVISRRWELDFYAKPEVELGHLSKAATQKYNTSPWVKFGSALWVSFRWVPTFRLIKTSSSHLVSLRPIIATSVFFSLGNGKS